MRWLVTGASGLLGNALCFLLAKNGADVWGAVNNHQQHIPNVSFIRQDFSDNQNVSLLIKDANPDIVVHAAGLTNVDECEKNENLARIIHADIAENFARTCYPDGRKFINISTDHLWDGSKSLISENEPLSPINAYARTKAEGEARVREVNPEALIVRTNFFGNGLPWRKSISDWMIHSLLSRGSVRGFSDSFFTPISLDHLTSYIVRLSQLNAQGIYHIAGSERLSKYEFAQKIAGKLSLPKYKVLKTRLKNADLKALRPIDLSLNTQKICELLEESMPNVDDGLNTLGIQ